MSEPSAIYTGIVATVFGGAADPQNSAYTGQRIGDDVLGCALPYRFTGARPRVRVTANGRSVDCEIVDVGPWNINDPYWLTGARPQAESGVDMTGRVTNRAGIDLTPAAARAIGIDGKGIVQWGFITEARMPTPQSPQQSDPRVELLGILLAQAIPLLEKAAQNKQVQAGVGNFIDKLLTARGTANIGLLGFIGTLLAGWLDLVGTPTVSNTTTATGGVVATSFFGVFAVGLLNWFMGRKSDPAK